MWKLLAGNPYTLIALGVVLLGLLSASFGYGFYVATGRYEDKLLAQQQEIAAAQHERDVADHKRAVASSELAKTRHALSEKSFQGITEKLDALPEVADNACTPTSDVIDLLNQAGHE